MSKKGGTVVSPTSRSGFVLCCERMEAFRDGGAAPASLATAQAGRKEHPNFQRNQGESQGKTGHYRNAHHGAHALGHFNAAQRGGAAIQRARQKSEDLLEENE